MSQGEDEMNDPKYDLTRQAEKRAREIRQMELLGLGRLADKTAGILVVVFDDPDAIAKHLINRVRCSIARIRRDQEDDSFKRAG